MTKAYQSIYVKFCRWSFKNFGQGALPQFKSLFNVSFLLVVVLTNAMLFTKLLVKAQWLTLNMSSYVAILFGAVAFLLLNHFILLNNRMFKKLNARLATISAHNKNLFSVVLLVNVLCACGLCFIR
ncbi:hypothetical protein GWR56_04070 [Mucilaginibacter sp. 14171R-50]|uniref:hypothetical protein n=1 Tax=Mucilaginibacter sp. 14171R-50 TaxID=2703789 RepID=UPI00138DBCD3|nr:hypothetical protein [Mucilaginibacter sp. 14171R-50]QHS54759.1 hypothetical protein GWR56_04070 [Mucilaginibacter sp. 14171R-50]